MMFKKKIKIKYRYPDITHIEKIKIGDWIDLRVAEDTHLKRDEFKLIDLGVAIQLPKGYEAIVVPRSSTFKNFKIIQANSMGVIDNSYCGPEDYWKFPAIALRDTVLHKNDRICQFRIQKIQPKLEFETVTDLSNVNRGGIGSTGTN